MAETPLAQVRQEYGLDVEWMPFELRPEPVPTLDPQGEYLRTAWTRSVYPLAARLGVEIKLPPVQPRTRLAHEAFEYARRQGRAAEMADKLFQAFSNRAGTSARWTCWWPWARRPASTY